MRTAHEGRGNGGRRVSRDTSAITNEQVLQANPLMSGTGAAEWVDRLRPR